MDRDTWEFRLFVIDALLALLVQRNTIESRRLRDTGKRLRARFDPVTEGEGREWFTLNDPLGERTEGE